MIGTHVRPPKALRLYLAALERRVADGIEEAIARGRRERAIAMAEELELEAARLRAQAERS